MNNIKFLNYLIVVVALLAAVVVFQFVPMAVRFGGFNAGNLAQQLTPLFLV